MLFTQKESISEVWESIRQELHRGALDDRHPFHLVNMGTLSNGMPEVRSVVLRKVDKDLNCYVFTDFRTRKVEELSENPNVSLHLYHPEKRVQIRIKAKAEIHHQNELSRSFWESVRGASQLAYLSKLPSGTPIPNPGEAFQWLEIPDDRFFTVLKIVPEFIEALQLNELKHLKIVFLGKGWVGQWLVP